MNTNLVELLPGIFYNGGDYSVDSNKYTYHTEYKGVKLLELYSVGYIFRQDKDISSNFFGNANIKVYVRYSKRRMLGCIVIYKGSDIYALNIGHKDATWNSNILAYVINAFKLLDLFTDKDFKERKFFLRHFITGEDLVHMGKILMYYTEINTRKFSYMYYEYDKTYLLMYLKDDLGHNFNYYTPAIDLISKELVIMKQLNIYTTGVIVNGNLTTLQKQLRTKLKYNNNTFYWEDKEVVKIKGR